MFNVPLVVLLIAASMPTLFFFQRDLPDMGMSMAFAPIDMEQGRWGGLLTAMLLHGGWTHAIMNAVAALAFGTPVARLFGTKVGPTVFLLFYLVCGVLASLGYGLIHWGSSEPMVGASGAVFGLIGAATRLLGGQGRVLPMGERRVIGAAITWMGGLPGAEGARIAWEAHAVGFVVGFLAIGPLGRMFGSGAAPRP